MSFQLLLTLWAGHYLADFGLQTKMMAEKKKFIFKEAIGFHALAAHAFIHGLIAGVITQNFTAGFVVGALHWLVDLRAAEVVKERFNTKKDLFGIHMDQFLHFLVILAVTWRLS